MIDLSIIIVTFNSGDFIRACLASVIESRNDLSTEIIMVDNNSEDGTPERIAHSFPQVHIITNNDNRGFSAANNQGLAQAKGRYLLLLNPDVIVQQDTLRTMINALEDSTTLGIVGPRTFDINGEIALTARPTFTASTVLSSYLKLDWIFPNRLHAVYRRACREAQAPFDVGWVQGSCLMLKRDIYQQIGGLDAAFFLFYEETDFCERAIQAGWRISYLPDSSVIHHGSSTVSKYVPIKVRSHHMSPLYYFRKRGRRAAIVALKLGFTIELVLKSLIRLLQMLWERDEAARLRLRTYFSVLGEVWRY